MVERRYLFYTLYSGLWKNTEHPSRPVGLRPPGMMGALKSDEFDKEFLLLEKKSKKIDFAKPLEVAIVKTRLNHGVVKKVLSLLEEAKIKYKLKPFDLLELNKIQSSGEYDLMLVMLGASEYDPDTAWRIFNDVNFAKPPATKAELNRALMEKDIKKREDMYKEFERRAIREALFIPLKNEPTYIITSKKLKLDKKLAADWGLQIYKLRLK